eukprot:s5802_g5.t1
MHAENATPVSQRSLEDQERLEVTGGISVVVQVIAARLRAFPQQGRPLVHALSCLSWPREAALQCKSVNGAVGAMPSSSAIRDAWLGG